ncbi:MAG: 4Fe-4S binding protein [Chloroflexia bacterium]|nr:4Fe-4S binding protein [Chloroflexia bacterium]
MPDKLLSWKEAAMGGVVTRPGSSADYHTGTWRSTRPVHDDEQCVHCLTCWVYCPDSAIIVQDGRWTAFDYDHCKGCGICAEVCPVNIKQPHAVTGEMGHVIQMIPETEAE